VQNVTKTLALFLSLILVAGIGIGRLLAEVVPVHFGGLAVEVHRNQNVVAAQAADTDAPDAALDAAQTVNQNISGEMAEAEEDPYAIQGDLVFPDGSSPDKLVGLTIAQVSELFGPPKEVYAVRGRETWQDDVVFVYDGFDLYLYKNRVWQASVKEALGMRVGDVKGVAQLILGQPAEETPASLVYNLKDTVWPHNLRINLNKSGKISAIIFYRADQ
jgi:hypothetical protein